MIAAGVTTAAVAAVSVFVPATPIEAYLIAAITTTGADPVALGIAAGLGQTADKLLTFLAARGASSGRAGSGDRCDGAPVRPQPDRLRVRRWASQVSRRQLVVRRSRPLPRVPGFGRFWIGAQRSSVRAVRRLSE